MHPFLLLHIAISEVVLVLLAQRPQGPGRHRRPSFLWELVALVAGGVRAGFAKLVDHDLPLVTATALLVFGTVFNALAAIGGLVLDNVRLCWLFGASGSASWLFALGIFCIFPPTSSPRHGGTR